MPFAYFGAKHGLASKYPRPAHDLIIEPFAGAAGYSCHHSALGKRVLLNDLDPLICEAWERVQHDPNLLGKLDEAILEDRTSDILIAGLASESTRYRNRQITERMRANWANVRDRIEAVAPLTRGWGIANGDYRDLPDVEATWFIDPPYAPLLNARHQGAAGRRYLCGADGIDFSELADWCQSRKGQVIVCEQSPAAWLPFTPLATQANMDGKSRSEVVWLSQQQQEKLF